jgi:hypothetical protein
MPAFGWPKEDPAISLNPWKTGADQRSHQRFDAEVVGGCALSFDLKKPGA